MSKLISGALRHFPGALGLRLDEEGFVSIETLAEAIKRREGYEWVLKEHIIALAQTDPKGRFEISEGKIRARYGHSIPVKIHYPEAYPDTFLYHGTSFFNLKSIRRLGILPMKRRFVHLTTNFEDAASRARSWRDPVVLVIDPKKLKGKVNLYKAGRDVYVAPHVPPDSVVSVISLGAEGTASEEGGDQHG